MRIFLYHGYWTRQSVASDHNSVYLFGDNVADSLSGYVPSTTQAVIRGLPNAIGIPTKRDRRTSAQSYFTDADLPRFAVMVDDAVKRALDSGKDIIIPADGIGTGKAQLNLRAPKCYAYLVKALNSLVKAAKQTQC